MSKTALFDAGFKFVEKWQKVLKSVAHKNKSKKLNFSFTFSL
jgi:hypothetical protein